MRDDGGPYIVGADADLADIALPAPRMEGGKPLMEALKARQSTRAFSAKPLPLQVMSDLLWAACGINRPDSGKRTAPSARNWQEVDVYAVMEEGAYLYDAKANSLRAVAKGDLRKLTGKQEFVATAPLNLVYVADISKMKGAAPEDQARYIGRGHRLHQPERLPVLRVGRAGHGGAGLGGPRALAKALNLPEQQKIVLAQTVGYPAP